MLKILKAAAYMPDPVRSRPHITARHRELAAMEPPQPAPFHCKPWMDEQSLGWTLLYPYLTPITIIGLGDGGVEIENLDQLRAESRLAEPVRPFLDGEHIGLPAPGYTLLTPPGVISLILPPTSPPAGCRLLPAVMETDWYPLETPMLFAMPGRGERFTLDYEAEMARVVPVPRPSPDESVGVVEGEELTDLLARRQAYQAEYGRRTGKLMATDGQLKQTYNAWSARRRRGETQTAAGETVTDDS